uniref:Uncharacterized protein n=1 Tax=Anguilla anguilla TaxID=7936 RepID=A0A0E9UGR3_ANGAN
MLYSHFALLRKRKFAIMHFSNRILRMSLISLFINFIVAPLLIS